jgi:hypothetical protein
MDKTELVKIFTRQQRIDVDFPNVRREVDGSVVRHISLDGGDGYVMYSRLDEDSAEAIILAQIARFQSIPQNFEWKVYDYDTPEDLIERLRRHGFEIDEPEAVLVLDLASAPKVLDLPAPASVVRISDPGDVDAIVALENEVWDTDHHDLGELLKRTLREHPEKLSVYISYEGRQPASAAWVYFHPDSRFASLWGGSTLPIFRKLGHYSRLLAARAQEARARGFSLLTVDASPMSRPILEKHGFQYLAAATPCKWTVQA